MSVVFIVLPVALVVVLAAVAAFLWAARRGQFDDLTTPAFRALQDEGAALGEEAAGRLERGSGGGIHDADPARR